MLVNFQCCTVRMDDREYRAEYHKSSSIRKSQRDYCIKYHRRTPRVVFRTSFRLSSCKYSKESAGIFSSVLPTLNHSHNRANKTHVVSSFGADVQMPILFTVPNFACFLGGVPQVSMDMRRISAYHNSPGQKRKKETFRTRAKIDTMSSGVM